MPQHPIVSWFFSLSGMRLLIVRLCIAVVGNRVLIGYIIAVSMGRGVLYALLKRYLPLNPLKGTSASSTIRGDDLRTF